MTHFDDGLTRTPDPRQDPGPQPAQPEPVGAVVLGARTAARARGWLTGLPCWTEPRPPHRALVDEARRGEWTLRDWQRTPRVVWLHTVHGPARLLPWLVLRCPPAHTTSGPAAELPSIAQVRDRTAAGRVVRVCYPVASAAAQLTESATRTLAAGAGLWVAAHAANRVPGLRALVPEQVTVGWWWTQLTQFVAGVFSSATGAAERSAPAVGQVAGPIVVGLLALGVLVLWARNKTNSAGEDS